MNEIKSLSRVRISAGLRDFLLFIFILLTMTATYFPAVSSYYVHHDDYLLWAWKRDGFQNHPQFAFMMAIGRFIGVYILLGLGSLVTSVYDANIIRFVSIFTLSLCAWLLFLWLRPYFKTMVHPFLLSLLIFTLPPFQVFAGWASTAYCSIATLFAILAGIMADRIPMEKPTLRGLIDKHVIGSVGLLFCALITHPMPAMFYWVIAAFYMVLEKPTASSTRWKQKMLVFALVGFSTISIYAVMLRFVKAHYIRNTVGSYNPYVMTSDPVRKLVWFIRDPLFTSLNLWNIFPNSIYSWTIIMFILITIASMALVRRSLHTMKEQHYSGDRLIWLSSMFFILIILSYLPGIVAIGTFAPYRSNVALVSMVIVIMMWALQSWILLLQQKLQKTLWTVILFAACAWGISRANHNVKYYFAISDNLELRYIQNIVRTHDLRNYNKIHVVMPEKAFVGPEYRNDEFASPATINPRDIPWIIRCACSELGVLGELGHFRAGSFGKKDEHRTADASTLVIDMTQLSTSTKMCAQPYPSE